MCAQLLMHALAHGGCTNTVRESALKVDSVRKILCRTGESNPLQRRAGPTLYPERHPSISFVSVQLASGKSFVRRKKREREKKTTTTLKQLTASVLKKKRLKRTLFNWTVQFSRKFSFSKLRTFAHFVLFCPIKKRSF